MVIIRINGGLGNQMFQYAAAKRLAYRKNTDLKLDIVELVDSFGYHIYGLKYFCIREHFASPAEILRYFPNEGFKRLCRKVVGKKFTQLFFNLVLRDKTERLKRRYYNYDPDSEETVKLIEGRILSQRFFNFDPEVLSAPDNVYMTGSFISEIYFKDIEEIIRNEFKFKSDPSEEDIKIIRMINDCESVAIHFRRGEFVENSQNKLSYGFIDDYYYNKCVSYIASIVKNPVFFVFSDDMEWAKKNFIPSYSTFYVDHNYDAVDYRADSGTDFQDMRLMSQCKHNIISNSTFSWWGAWLNQNPGKTVCAPKEFVRISNFDNKDMLPDEWIKF